MTTQTSDSLLSTLGLTLQGSLHTDTVMKTLYATDASAYREMPLGVAIPESKEDLEKIILFANQQSIPMIPRTAGTSLAGTSEVEGTSCCCAAGTTKPCVATLE